eukprot:CAMPEP_0204644796 /NCGR_PEP_ID=MMETSP0718-20130828/1734_1 /ASSEMBLY_ACC=CAM_ASM_000674 /TAXON_ID=230516 /ORGANISM="Chaetoceros curvisetus" /LENGTH=216 /DNA_ID=CAMNT_0051666467 /DNA_START=84 /DNA_END=734 /DNA_ORIENTATION=+
MTYDIIKKIKYQQTIIPKSNSTTAKPTTIFLSKEGGRSLGGEGGGAQGLHIPLGTGNTVGEGELNILLGELHSVDPLQVTGLKSGGPNDLDGTGTGTVPSGHFVVKLSDGPSKLEVTVLPVHIMCSGTGRVTKPDSVVLDDTRVLLKDLYTVKDLSGGLLHLTELVHVVPELGLGDDGVGCEDDHTVCLGVGVFISSGFAANNLVLVHLSCDSHFM